MRHTDVDAEHQPNDGVGAAIRWGVLGLAAAVAWAGTAFGWIDWPVVEGWVVQHAVTLSLGGLTVLLVGGAVWRVLPRKYSSSSTPTAARPPLSWWMVAIAVGVVAAVAWGATTGLLQVASTAKDPAAAQVDAIKTGLSIAAGTGGVFALLLAVRRQWHQELTAADVTGDATARRITELYTKAADQLGSDKAPVRLAGLYALERLAQDNPGQRPTIVQVMCAYLRMPYTPPETTPEPEATAEERQEHRDLVQEREVRLTAQRILATHIRPGSDPDGPASTFWPDTSLDLTGATLIHFNLSRCHLHTARFGQAQFIGNARFNEAKFVEAAEFAGVKFAGSAEFAMAEFAENARFDLAKFAGSVRFDGAKFAATVRFGGAEFGMDASFTEVKFGMPAVANGVKFAGSARFDGAKFCGNAWFRRSKFAGDAGFYDATFGGIALFSLTMFTGDAEFDGATFVGSASFDGVGFAGNAEFDEAQFVQDVTFDKVQFAEGIGFNRVAQIDESLEGRRSCWVRVDVPDTVAKQRHWPTGWTVQQPGGERPPGQNEGQWSRLVNTLGTSMVDDGLASPERAVSGPEQ